jgi:hypothetical protein
MSSHLRKFLEGNYAVSADELQQTADELHAELRALPEVRMDFTTPEGAIFCLEEAYRRQDIEAAVAAKDFKMEALLLLQKTRWKDYITEEAVAGMAEVLESSFRAHTTSHWPDFAHLESFFPSRNARDDGIVAITEVCRFPDGLFSFQRILVAETAEEWRVLNPL